MFKKGSQKFLNSLSCDMTELILGCGSVIFKGFLPYMGMLAILFIGQQQFV